MSTRFIDIDRTTPMLLPPDLRSWVADDDLVHFVLEAVESLPLSTFRVNARGTGSAQYPPRMLLGLLIYCYANGVFSSRRIERATYRDIGVRYLTGNTHPDHDTICAFRRKNFAAVSTAFLAVLKLARELKLLKVGTISVDGTHLKANASKFKSIRYDRACELEEQLKLEIEELLQKAEQADSSSSNDDQSLPKELAHREQLRKKLAAAREKLEQRAQAQAEAEQEAYREKLKKREERPNHRKGPKPKPPLSSPKPSDQINLTDEDARIMRKNSRSEYQQAYNAQAAVDADGSQLVLSAHVSTCAADNGELLLAVENVSDEIGTVSAVLADSGYVDADVFDQLQACDIEPYVPPGRNAASQRRRHDFRPETTRPEKVVKDPRLIQMREKLKIPENRDLYALRKQTVEPVFGIIKQAMGFRQFLLRGFEKVSGEWQLLCLAYNMKRLFNLKTAKTA